jgi:hypothetical protein
MISRRSSGSSRVESAVEPTSYARSPTPAGVAAGSVVDLRPIRAGTFNQLQLHPPIPFDVSGIAVELSDCGT